MKHEFSEGDKVKFKIMGINSSYFTRGLENLTIVRVYESTLSYRVKEFDSDMDWYVTEEELELQNQNWRNRLK